MEEEEESGAKRATSRFRDCSDIESELPATWKNTQIKQNGESCSMKSHPFCRRVGRKAVFLGAVALLFKIKLS